MEDILRLIKKDMTNILKRVLKKAASENGEYWCNKCKEHKE